MNQYIEFMQYLSDKFGTTVEHLWEVLLYQAQLNAIIQLVVVISLISLTVWGFNFIKAKTTDRIIDGKICDAEWSDDGRVVLAGLFWLVTLVVVVIIACSSVEIIVSGFLNPEYWALQQLRVLS